MFVFFSGVCMGMDVSRGLLDICREKGLKTKTNMNEKQKQT